MADKEKAAEDNDLETGQNGATENKSVEVDCPLQILHELDKAAVNSSSSNHNIIDDSGKVKDNDAKQHDHEEDDGDSDSISTTSSGLFPNRPNHASRIGIVATLILVVGATASALILSIGIRVSKENQQSQFDRLSAELVQQFETAMNDYATAGLWIHQACFMQRETMTMRDFRVVYEYLSSTGLEMQAAAFVVQITDEAERERFENHTRAMLQEDYPDKTYAGVVGFNDPGQPPGPRDKADNYLVAQLVEPMEDPKNAAALHFDVGTLADRRVSADEAFATGKPALTERLKLIKEGLEGSDQHAFSTILLHPGIPLSNRTPSAVAGASPRDLAFIVIRFPDTLVRARQDFQMDHASSLYIYDSTQKIVANADPAFLGGALFHSDNQVKAHPDGALVTYSNEIELAALKETSFQFLYERNIPIASRQWTFVVVAPDNTFEMEGIIFVIIGAAMIFLATVCLAAWVITNHRRVENINRIKAESDRERARLMVENAQRVAHKEREMNDFLSHEVRNPISAAISACSFVSSAIQDASKSATGSSDSDDRTVSQQDLQMIEEDITIIDSSLSFVNDLLRNMLDMHRATSNQMKIEMEPVNLLCDVLEPVASMLYQRGSNFQVLLECPENLVVMTDKLRMKQTCLNLGRNSTKFVNHGFVRLRADVVEGKVHVYVEDSGSGVPVEKRSQIFGKFQETLDSLSQGTGIGLSLCKKLVELMGGQLWLEESYDSGVEGCPGACFVVNLNSAPLSVETIEGIETAPNTPLAVGKSETSIIMDKNGRQLPENLTVLFCDDDWKLRTLCSRAIDRVTNGWTIREASNGETALRLAEEQEFDIVFQDQYMSSVVKQLLGTETVQAMRSRGVESAICGVSCNALEGPFLKAGANMFIEKPLPVDNQDLVNFLFQVLDSKGNHVNTKPIARNPIPKAVNAKKQDASSGANSEEQHSTILPKHLSVLVMDDDANLRQLLTRSLRRAAPEWTILEAENGPSAVKIIEKETFDLCFLDQFMPNPQEEKPMMGTDVAAIMRAKGVKSILCGLSANDCETSFLRAGADCFHLKPFTCEKVALILELAKILGLDDNTSEMTDTSGPVVCLGVNEKKAIEESGLPTSLSVLYVDDSSSLRKMFARSLQRAATGWNIQVAENGEAALQMVESNAAKFDLIFLDQHMNTDMLGSDAIKLLRAKGVTAIVCGLSGDDIASTFTDAGADCFMMKPFPCEKEQLTQELKRILASR